MCLLVRLRSPIATKLDDSDFVKNKKNGLSSCDGDMTRLGVGPTLPGSKMGRNVQNDNNNAFLYPEHCFAGGICCRRQERRCRYADRVSHLAKIRKWYACDSRESTETSISIKSLAQLTMCSEDLKWLSLSELWHQSYAGKTVPRIWRPPVQYRSSIA